MCGDRIVNNGNKLTEKLDKLNEVYNQVIASSNLLTKVRGVTFFVGVFFVFKNDSLLFNRGNTYC